MKQKRTLAELAVEIGGQVLGNPSLVITGVAPTHLATDGELTFLLDEKHAALLEHCKASAVMVPIGTEHTFPNRNLLIVDNVSKSFDRVAELFRPARTTIINGISERAVIDSSAKLGRNVNIGAGAYIGSDVHIGDNCTIYPNSVILDGTTIGTETIIFPNAVIYENCSIGSRCIIHASTTIGAYGFGYESTEVGHQISAQLGNVVLEDEVEVGACSTIDRATHGSTIIGFGSKIDNLVMIAHNCRIGRFNLICAHTGIAGSTTTGDYVVMAGRVGIKDHTHIGSGAVLGAMAGVMGDIPEKTQYVGIPATEFKTQFRQQAAIAKLPEMRREFIALQREVRQLNERLAKLSESNS